METTLTTTAGLGEYASIALDPQGNPAIVHTGRGAGQGVWYSRKEAGEWSHECIDGRLYTEQSSLALDAQGNPHLSYQAGPFNILLYYAHRTGSGWVIEQVDTTGVGFPHATSIGLDSKGSPHIAYRHGQGAWGLRHATRSSGAWTIDELDIGGNNSGLSVSLEIDALDNPQLAYIDRDAGELIHARKPGSFWTMEIVDDGLSGLINAYCSLELRPVLRPLIAYQDPSVGVLKYAEKVGSLWVIETVDDGGGVEVGRHCSLALDTGQNPHISYQRRPSFFVGDLRYARKAGEIWFVTTVDAGAGNVGEFTSIVVDGGPSPHIGYLARTNSFLGGGNLKYARGALPVGVPTESPGPRLTLRAVPNPSGTGGSVIHLRVPAPVSGEVAVFDVTGRRVATLFRGTMAAGEHTVPWTGKDLRGDRVAPGVYLLRLRAGQETRTERLTLLR